MMYQLVILSLRVLIYLPLAEKSNKLARFLCQIFSSYSDEKASVFVSFDHSSLA
jgi:hypothetical protein